MATAAIPRVVIVRSLNAVAIVRRRIALSASDIVSNKEIETFQAQIDTAMRNYFETLMRELLGSKRLVLTELAAIKTAVILPQEPQETVIYDELVDV